MAISKKDYEGAKGASLKKFNSYLMTDGMNIGIYDEQTFKQTDTWLVDTVDNDPDN